MCIGGFIEGFDSEPIGICPTSMEVCFELSDVDVHTILGSTSLHDGAFCH